MKIKCSREDCQHEWDYGGHSKFYITCPHCYNKVNLKKIKQQKERVKRDQKT